MYAQIARRLDPFGRRLAALLLAAVAGCTTPPAPLAGPDPSDPHAPSRPVAYRPVVGPYTSARPADPAAWREHNERVAPPAKP